MGIVIDELGEAPWRDFDTVIDVRAPSEFAEDHLPGAVSMPVLDDDERARVGTIYKQDSPFVARKVGAALVARNSAAHIETHLMGREGGWRPLVYCWRGGQRSGSFATILRQIGWRVELVEGGYRAYRRAVVRALYERELPFRLLRLDGNTGTAKTELLGLLRTRGVQTVDLEALAGHRGSALGAREGGQPAQKGFESALAEALWAYDPARVVLVEAESSRIGELRLPPSLWKAMCSAPRLVVEAPVAARAAYLASAYRDVTARPDMLLEMLDKLRALAGHERVDRWQALVGAGEWMQLSEELIRERYDPAYARVMARDTSPVLQRFATEDLGADELQRLAGQIEAASEQFDRGAAL